MLGMSAKRALNIATFAAVRLTDLLVHTPTIMVRVGMLWPAVLYETGFRGSRALEIEIEINTKIVNTPESLIE